MCGLVASVRQASHEGVSRTIHVHPPSSHRRYPFRPLLTSSTRFCAPKTFRTVLRTGVCFAARLGVFVGCSTTPPGDTRTNDV